MKVFFVITVICALPMLFSNFSKESPIKEEKNLLQFQSESLKIILENLKNDSLSKLKIFHLGDSHVQIGGIEAGLIDFLNENKVKTESILYFPTTIFSDLYYSDVKITTTGNWQGSTLTNELAKEKIGFAGRNFHLVEEEGAIKIHTKKDPIQKIIIYHSSNNLQISAELAIVKKSKIDLNFYKTELIFQEKTDKVLLQVGQDIQENNVFYGIEIHSEKDVNKYYRAGISGVKYDDVFFASTLLKQIKLIQPDLIFITLGTNDSYYTALDTANFNDKLNLLFSNLTGEANFSNLIAMSVPDTYYEKESPINLSFVNKNIVQVCEKNNFAFWNWNEIMGGMGSIHTWNEFNLIDKDFLHFNYKGYRLIGESFAKALVKK